MKNFFRFVVIALAFAVSVNSADIARAAIGRSLFSVNGTPATGVPVNTVAPAIPSSAQVGTVLNATTGTWTQSPTGYAYQWKTNCSTPISGATAASYTPVLGDVGNTLCVTVTATNGFGSTPQNSNTTSAVTNVTAPTNTVAPAITGLSPPQVGNSLSVSTGTWTGSPTGYSYQWKQDCTTPISGATSATYTPVTGDITHTLCATVTATNGGGSTPQDSNTTSAVIANAGSRTFSLPTGQSLHYMAASGCSDSNAGTSPLSPWCTAAGNGALSCGDVIIAKAGSYSAQDITTNAPTNCPSTSGGVDGTGGIYTVTVLCDGSGSNDLTSCNTAGFTFEESNWAVEGFACSNPSNFCLLGLVHGQVNTTTRIGYIAFINDIITHSQDACTSGDGGATQNVPGAGVGEFACIGVIAQNSNNDPNCVGAVDSAGPANFDSRTDTVIYFGQVFAINNQNPACTFLADGEGLFFDTPDAHAFTGTSVMQDNIAYSSSQAGIAIFQQMYHNSTLEIDIVNNSVFDDLVQLQVNTTGAALGELNFNITGGWSGWTINATNNLSLTNRANCGTGSGGGTGCNVYALVLGGNSGTTVNLNGNFFKGQQTGCLGTCDAGFNVEINNGFPFGSSTYTNPGYKNTADLLANHVGPPNCSGFISVVACMGFNFSTQSITALSVIDDMTATAGGTSGKGYRTPAPCAANTLYPTWVKGIVYLHWDGTNLTQIEGLTNKPCNL